MGEYATYRGQSIKIGTCESMYYLRADQAHLVTPERGSVDPIRDQEGIRYRFPFPDEDNILPGEFEDYSRTMRIDGLRVPDGVVHYSVQFKDTAGAGYLVSLPCPESPKGREQAELAGYTVHKNGWRGDFHIVQQRAWEGKLVLVAQCGGCGAAFRLPTLEDAAPVLEALDRKARDQEDPNNRFGSKRTAEVAREVARRILQGYTNPPEWVR